MSTPTAVREASIFQDDRQAGSGVVEEVAQVLEACGAQPLSFVHHQ